MNVVEKIKSIVYGCRLMLCEHDYSVMNAFVVGIVFYSKKCLLS